MFFTVKDSQAVACNDSKDLCPGGCTGQPVGTLGRDSDDRARFFMVGAVDVRVGGHNVPQPPALCDYVSLHLSGSSLSSRHPSSTLAA